MLCDKPLYSLLVLPLQTEKQVRWLDRRRALFKSRVAGVKDDSPRPLRVSLEHAPSDLRPILLHAILASHQRQRRHPQKQSVLHHAHNAANLRRGGLRFRNPRAPAVQNIVPLIGYIRTRSLRVALGLLVLGLQVGRGAFAFSLYGSE